MTPFASFRTFLQREVIPHYADWESDGLIPREVYAAAGTGGSIGMAVPEEYGGARVDDLRLNVVLIEECSNIQSHAPTRTHGSPGSTAARTRS
jgi:acyl-CoA dehydrogenase